MQVLETLQQFTYYYGDVLLPKDPWFHLYYKRLLNVRNPAANHPVLARSEHDPPEQYLMSDVNAEFQRYANWTRLTPSQSISGILSDRTHNISIIPWAFFSAPSTWQLNKKKTHLVTCGESSWLRIWISCWISSISSSALSRSMILIATVCCVRLSYLCQRTAHHYQQYHALNTRRKARTLCIPLQMSPFLMTMAGKRQIVEWSVCWRCNGVVYLYGPALRRSLLDQSDVSPRASKSCYMVDKRWTGCLLAIRFGLPRYLTIFAVGR